MERSSVIEKKNKNNYEFYSVSCHIENRIVIVIFVIFKYDIKDQGKVKKTKIQINTAQQNESLFFVRESSNQVTESCLLTIDVAFCERDEIFYDWIV